MTDTISDRIGRLKDGYYNSDDKGLGNPGGLGDDGHVDNFPAALSDVGAAAQHVGELAADTAAAAAAVAAAAPAAIAAAEAAQAAAAGLNMPSVTADDAGKALVVNTSGTGFVTGTLTTTYWGGAAAGSANALAISTGASLTGVVRGMIIGFIVSTTNTGNVTISIDGLPPISVKKNGLSLSGGELRESTSIIVQYDGSEMQIISAVTEVGRWIKFKLWGGAGAGMRITSGGSYGGAGAAVEGMIYCFFGESIGIGVGGGGVSRWVNDGVSGLVSGGWPNGGGVNLAVSNAQAGGTGGGRSYVKYRGSERLVAAGGGGGNDAAGGAGGGLSGTAGGNAAGGDQNTLGGGGGTSSAGGAGSAGAGGGAAGTAGGAHRGGVGGASPEAAPARSNGAGGGDGHYGGGGTGGAGSASSSRAGGGGGGSSYVDTSVVSNAVLYAGAGATPGNAADPDRGSAGAGGAPNADGQIGRIVVIALNHDGGEYSKNIYNYTGAEQTYTVPW